LTGPEIEPTQQDLNYARIEKAIHYIRANLHEQPSLQQVASAVNLSPHHFQRLFTEWAGISPKKFMQFLNIQYAKALLKNNTSLLDTATELGLSGTGRLHDLFVTLESMTPGEFKNGGEALRIHYSFANSPFGPLIIASTSKGICQLRFIEDEQHGLNEVKRFFPNAHWVQDSDSQHDTVQSLLNRDLHSLRNIKLHLLGTRFQLKIWESLLTIPQGTLRSYSDVARSIGSPKSARAVGGAIGANPIAYLIPCHRVIKSSGELGNYMWGSARKAAIIGWEAAQVSNPDVAD